MQASSSSSSGYSVPHPPPPAHGSDACGSSVAAPRAAPNASRLRARESRAGQLQNTEGGVDAVGHLMIETANFGIMERTLGSGNMIIICRFSYDLLHMCTRLLIISKALFDDIFVFGDTPFSETHLFKK